MSGQPQLHTFFTALATTFPLSLAHSSEPQVAPPALKSIQDIDAMLCRPRKTTVSLKRPRTDAGTPAATLLRVSTLLHGVSESAPFFLQVGSAMAVATPLGFDRAAVRYDNLGNANSDCAEKPCEAILSLVPMFALRSDFIPRVPLSLPSQFSLHLVVIELHEDSPEPIWRILSAARNDLVVRSEWRIPEGTTPIDFGSQAYLDLVCRREICRMLTRAGSVPVGSDRDFSGDVDCAVLRAKFPCLSFLRTDALQKYVLDSAVTRAGEFVSQCADGALRVRAACFGGLFSAGSFLSPAEHCQLLECESSFLQSCCLANDGGRLDWPFPRAQVLLEQLGRSSLACQMFGRSATLSHQLHDVLSYVVQTRRVVRGRSAATHHRFHDSVHDALLRLLKVHAVGRANGAPAAVDDINGLCHYLALTQMPSGVLHSDKKARIQHATRALKQYLRGEAVNLQAMLRHLPSQDERSDSLLLLQGLFDSPRMPHEDQSALPRESSKSSAQSQRLKAMVRRNRQTGLFEVTFDADQMQAAWNVVTTSATPSSPVCASCRATLHAAQRECPRFLIEAMRLHQVTPLPRTFTASTTAVALGDAVDDTAGALMTHEEWQQLVKQPTPRQPANEYVESALAVVSAHRHVNERRAARSKQHVWETVCSDVLEGLRLDKNVKLKLLAATLTRAPSLESRKSWERFLLDEFPSEQPAHINGKILDDYRERVQRAILSKENEIAQYWGGVS